MLALSSAICVLIFFCAALAVALAELSDQCKRLDHARQAAYAEGFSAAQAELRRRMGK
jgi:hypothetical protein